MARSKIAPVLSALLDDLEDLANGKKPHPEASKEGDRGVIALAREDLRSLLSISNAVGRAKRAAYDDPKWISMYVERAFRAHDRAVARRSPAPRGRGRAP